MSLGRRIKTRLLKTFLVVYIVLAPLANTRAAEPSTSSDSLNNPPSGPVDRDRFAPADFGGGPGAPPRSETSLLQRAMKSVSGLAQQLSLAPQTPGTQAPATQTPTSARLALAVPRGGSSVATQGFLGAPIAWPIIPIHMIMLPDGRIMTYGTNQKGTQGAALIYDVWDPGLGTGSAAHLVLPNSTATDIFCSAQSLALNGSVLISGGDFTVNGKRNFSNNQSTVFYPLSNAIVAAGAMAYPRWYASLVPLPDGRKLVLGGRTSPTTYATIPEIYTTGIGYRTLGINMSTSSWYYPKAFVGPNGIVYIVNPSGTIASITTAGNGVYSISGPLLAPGLNNLPVISYAPGELLSIRQGGIVDLIDLNAGHPRVTQLVQSTAVTMNRQWASSAIMADGKVLLSGGSSIDESVTFKLEAVSYTTAIWDPNTLLWTAGPTATKPRLYHSGTLLLQDGSVLTGGGGAPGVINELNAEIYYPAYLYMKDGSGLPAPRPTLVSLQAFATAGSTVSATVGATDSISRVTLVRTGSETHVVNLEERFFDLPFYQSGNGIVATLPANTNNLLPGYYMFFVFNGSGAPAVSQVIKINPSS